MSVMVARGDEVVELGDELGEGAFTKMRCSNVLV